MLVPIWHNTKNTVETRNYRERLYMGDYVNIWFCMPDVTSFAIKQSTMTDKPAKSRNFLTKENLESTIYLELINPSLVDISEKKRGGYRYEKNGHR